MQPEKNVVCSTRIRDQTLARSVRLSEDNPQENRGGRAKTTKEYKEKRIADLRMEKRYKEDHI